MDGASPRDESIKEVALQHILKTAANQEGVGKLEILARDVVVHGVSSVMT